MGANVREHIEVNRRFHPVGHTVPLTQLEFTWDNFLRPCITGIGRLRSTRTLRGALQLLSKRYR